MTRRLLLALAATCSVAMAMPEVAAARVRGTVVQGRSTELSGWLPWSLRFGSYLAIAFVVGVLVTELAVWSGAGLVRRLRRSCEVALGAVVILAGLQLLVLAADRSGTGVLSAWSGLGDAADTDAGMALVLRAALAVVAWLLVVRERPATQQTHRELALLLGLGLLATWSFTGRAGSGRWPWLGVTVDVVHHAAAASWIGALAIVGLVAVPRVEPLALTDVMRRFGRTAAIAVGMVVLTGVVQTVRVLGSPEEMSGSALGRLLVAKGGVVLVMLALMAATRRRASQALADAGSGGVGLVRSSLATELVAGLVALGLTASLVGTPTISVSASQAEGPAPTMPQAVTSTDSADPTTPPPPDDGSASTGAPASVVPGTVTPATVAPTTVAPTTTLPVIDLAVLPDVVAAASLGPVPDGTPVRSAGGDEAPVYENGCHVSWGATKPKQGCFYGDTSSDTLVVITGDSEAAHWFGAFDEAGKANGWKIAIVTKAGCPAADVKVYSAADPTNFYLPYPECPVWRQAALEYIRSLQPALVVFPMLSRRAIVGVPKKVALPNWQEGLGRSIDAIMQPGTKVLVLGDTPKTNGENVAQCVASRQSDVRPCGNTRDKAVDAVRAQGLAVAAAQHGATFVDPSNWMCTDDFCPAVIGTSVVYRDKLHLTDRFSRLRAPQIAGAIRYALSGPRP